MTPADMSLCDQWIRSYVKPARMVNHMHTSKGLWRMMVEDTHADVTHMQFKERMVRAGHEPEDPFVEEWEFRIGSKGLRRRPKAEVTGWQPSRDPYRMTRMA